MLASRKSETLDRAECDYFASVGLFLAFRFQISQIISRSNSRGELRYVYRLLRCVGWMEARGWNRTIREKVLRTPAFPLGYRAMRSFCLLSILYAQLAVARNH